MRRSKGARPDQGRVWKGCPDFPVIDVQSVQFSPSTQLNHRWDGGWGGGCREDTRDESEEMCLTFISVAQLTLRNEM